MHFTDHWAACAGFPGRIHAAPGEGVLDVLRGGHGAKAFGRTCVTPGDLWNAPLVQPSFITHILPAGAVPSGDYYFATGLGCSNPATSAASSSRSGGRRRWSTGRPRSPAWRDRSKILSAHPLVPEVHTVPPCTVTARMGPYRVQSRGHPQPPCTVLGQNGPHRAHLSGVTVHGREAYVPESYTVTDSCPRLN